VFVSKNVFRGRRLIATMASVAAAALAFAAQPAAASTLFNADVGAGAFTLTETLGHDFSFGYYYVQIHGQCFACVTATAPDGSSLGTFSFQTISGPFGYIANLPDAKTAMPAGGGYYSEHFDGYGTFDIDPPFNGPSLLNGGSNYFGVTVFAKPGSSMATFEFDLDQYATSDLIKLPNKPLYLDITGKTTSPITLASLTGDMNPIYAFAGPITVDFSIKLTDTPFSPGTGAALPEPGTWALMLAGFGALGGALRRRAVAVKA
jgi:hypothetical protein